LTVLGPLNGTVSVRPPGYCRVNSAEETGKESTSMVFGRTVIVKVQLVIWPQELLAVHVTIVVPIGKQLPLGGVQNSEGGGLQPPLAVLV